MVDKAIMATLPTIDISVFTVIVDVHRPMSMSTPSDADVSTV